MQIKPIRSPIIILGMHRSGTSLVVRLLEQLGYFAGIKQDGNNESLLFQSLNKWMLKDVTHGDWDYPENFENLLHNAEAKSIIVDYIQYALQSPRLVDYLGWGKYLRYRGLESLDFVWGWKDPRTTITFPIWREIFPECRVICIHRHGVDVANSLRERERKWLKEAHTKHAIRKKYGLYWFKKSGIINSLRCFSLEESFSLWETYSIQAERYVQELGKCAFSIRYEELLTNTDNIRQMVEFCELKVSEQELEKLISQINPERINAYKSNSELLHFAEQQAPRLARFGY